MLFRSHRSARHYGVVTFDIADNLSRNIDVFGDSNIALDASVYIYIRERADISVNDSISRNDSCFFRFVIRRIGFVSSE